MGGKRVIIRTLDIGADKQVDYFDMKKEENPALGVRAIRICLNRPEVFKPQLRALYRASAYGKVAIMFPMITSVWEVKECKRACQSVMNELTHAQIREKFNKQQEMKEMLATMKGQEDVTLDGKKINVYCNIGSPEDVAAVLNNDGQGIGLFRSEFL